MLLPQPVVSRQELVYDVYTPGCFGWCLSCPLSSKVTRSLSRKGQGALPLLITRFRCPSDDKVLGVGAWVPSANFS